MAKDWDGNKMSTFVCLGASNHTDKEREVNDFYATEPSAIDSLMAACSFFPRHVWECACGKGHLSERLKSFGFDVTSSDVVDRGYGAVCDFLKADKLPYEKECCIITNPPYKYATEFVLHAMDLLRDGQFCAMFLKTTFLEGQSRYERIFKNYPPRYICQFKKRVLCAINGEFGGIKSSAVSYAWFVWEKGYKGAPTVKWI